MTQFSEATHLLFDHDGVLVDTEFWYFQATRDEFTSLDIALELEEYMDHMVTGTSVIPSRIAEGERDAFRTRRNKRYADYLLSQDIQIPGVENTLASLHGRYPMAIVTTSRRQHFDLIHEHRHIRHYFDFVLTQGDYAREKPEPDPYLTALDRFGIEAGQALVIEDSVRGLRSAMAAGIPCVIVRNEFTADQDFTGASAYIETLTELPGLLGRSMPGLHAD